VTPNSIRVDITIIGGGLAGLVAANAAAERRARVRLVEAHSGLGGRARTTAPPYIAAEGPHVLYGDGPTWRWLVERELTGRVRPVPPSGLPGFRFRHGGRLRRNPPTAFLRPLLHRRLRAPVDRSYSDWASERFGEHSARLTAAASGVGLFTAEAGELSAAFVWERVLRVFAMPPAARYVAGGWERVIERMAQRATRLGAVIETGARATELPAGRVIVATSLDAARSLLGDESLRWPSGATTTLDLGIRPAPGDPFVVSDLDGAGWLERFSLPDPGLAPAGESLVQLQLPLVDGESTSQARSRIEQFAELSLPGWRDRVTWRRDATVRGRTGALDPVGASWRDRPAIDRGDGVYLAGDQVAAPGLLSEVSFSSAIRAVELALDG
jgi:phytoene dehydrogenase-like protein